MIHIGNDEIFWNRYEQAIACVINTFNELKKHGNEDAFLEAQQKLWILEDQKANNSK
jgi:hypothetical protein